MSERYALVKKVYELGFMIVSKREYGSIREWGQRDTLNRIDSIINLITLIDKYIKLCVQYGLFIAKVKHWNSKGLK
mgnify:CR=1 FL=1